MRVFLSGFMAAGKTSVGRELAKQLGVPFVDLDEAIENRQGKSVTDLFAEHGEAGFRRFEREELLRVADLEPVVVALGGGAVVAEENRRLIADRGTLVWLDVQRSTMLSRLQHAEASRPLGSDAKRTIELLDERLPLYRQCDIRFRPRERESVAQLAARIRTRLKS